MSKDVFHLIRVNYNGQYLHRRSTLFTNQRIDLINLSDQPGPRGSALCGSNVYIGLLLARQVLCLGIRIMLILPVGWSKPYNIRLLNPFPTTTGWVQAVAADILQPPTGDVLRDRCDEIMNLKNLHVSFEIIVIIRIINNPSIVLFKQDFLQGHRWFGDILGQGFACFLPKSRNPDLIVNWEPGMPSG